MSGGVKSRFTGNANQQFSTTLSAQPTATNNATRLAKCIFKVNSANFEGRVTKFCAAET